MENTRLGVGQNRSPLGIEQQSVQLGRETESLRNAASSLLCQHTLLPAPLFLPPSWLTKFIQAVASEEKEKRVRDGEIIFLDTPPSLFRMNYSFSFIYFCTSVRTVLYNSSCAPGGTELSFSWILDAVAIRTQKALGLCCQFTRLHSTQTRCSMDWDLRTTGKTLGAQPHEGPFLSHNCLFKRHSSKARLVALSCLLVVVVIV